MRLNNTDLFNTQNTDSWRAIGIEPPKFDRGELIEKTKSAPEWVHFGAGNIFRAFLADACQELILAGEYDKGVIAAEGFDYEIINRAFLPYDNIFINVTLKSDGDADKRAVTSITEAICANAEQEGFKRLREIFRNPSLKMASFTITEKGYSLQNPLKETLPDVLHDFENGTAAPRSYMGRIAALCYERFINGAKPFAMVSMDNCSHNGDKLFAAVNAFAEEWEKRGLVNKGFSDYIKNPELVSFPWTMIDKITPGPHIDVKKMLENSGIKGMDTIVTSKKSYAAPFVNAEQAQYLIIEDSFPNGKIPFDKIKAGIIYADRETVDRTEKMKVCTCLNPLHTALAVFGCLLGFTKINEEMKDADLHALAEKIGRVEGLPVVIDPKIISPLDFLNEVINVRLPNPFLPDAPQRIATDTSQKLPIRFGETIKAYIKSDVLSVDSLKLIPLVFAAWLRYLLGVGDSGEKFEVSPDPLFLSVTAHLRGIHLKDSEESTSAVNLHDKLSPVLSDAQIFGVNLYEAGLGEKVEGMFDELIEGKGAVRKTLQKYLAEVK